MIEELHRTAAAAPIIADWLGEGGKPVEQNLAEMRAFICELCPENAAPGWWDRFKTAIALAIRAALEVKHSMKLELSNEDKLHMCRVCGCCLRLKCWVPLEHLADHTSPEQLTKFPHSCWIPFEIKRNRHL